MQSNLRTTSNFASILTEQRGGSAETASACTSVAAYRAARELRVRQRHIGANNSQ